MVVESSFTTMLEYATSLREVADLDTARASKIFLDTFNPILRGTYGRPPKLVIRRDRVFILSRAGAEVASEPWPPWLNHPVQRFDVCRAFTETFVRLRVVYDQLPEARWIEVSRQGEG